MFRAIKLLMYPVRSLLLRLLPSLVLLYAVLMPAQLSLFSGYDTLDSVRRMYSLAQIFLPLSLLWPLFLYFLPVYGTQSREVLVAMGHPDGGCALLLWASHQIRTLPLYLLYWKMAPEEGKMVLLLFLQSILLCVGFVALLQLFRSAIVSMVLLAAYLSLALLMPWTDLPILIQYNRLWQDLAAVYFLARGVMLALALACILYSKKRSTSPG